MSYPDSVEYLYALGNEIKSAKFALDGISTLVEALGNPQREFRAVHVAGTNGKGSTCAMIDSGLRQAGHRAGLYTSPHLVEPTERIRIDGGDVTREQFARAFAIVHETAERLVRDGKLEHHTTYFETVTAMAFVLFRDAAVEFAVIETGLGGRLDATNVAAPELCVITSIDFDHEALLGSSIESIAAEKAGIIKPAVPVVMASQRLDAAAVLRRRALEVGATIIEVPCAKNVVVDPRDSEFTVNDLEIRCPLAGEHQVQNAATAATALVRLGVSPLAIQLGISSTTWPGRLEHISENPDIVLDGAHNPAGARALAAYIDRFHSRDKVWIVYGAMRDKSVQEITEILFPRAAKVILTAPSQTRAVRPEALCESSDHPDMVIADDVRDAVARACSAPAQVTVFVTGSLYLVGEARALFVE